MRRNNNIEWLGQVLLSAKWSIFLSILWTGMAGICGTVDPLLVRTLIDTALPLHRPAEALTLAFWITLCFVGLAGFSALASWSSYSAAQQSRQYLRASLLDQMMRFSMDYHDMHPTGEKVMHLDHDVEEIASIP